MAIARRSFLSGLATVGAALYGGGIADAAGLPAPGPAGQARAAQITVPMAATWQQATNDATINDTQNDSLNSRARCTAPFRSDLSDIVLAFPSWGLDTSEHPWPSPYVVTAAVEYPEGTFTPVYVNGKRELAVTPGFDNPQFDPCPVEIPAGATFYVKSFARWQGGMWLGRSQACVPLLDEWTYRGIGLTDCTLVPTRFKTTAQAAGFRPAVFARLSNPRTVLGILGASQEMAFGADCGDPVTGALFIGRAMRNQFPVISISRAGDSFGEYLYKYQGRHGLLAGRITDLMLVLGSNDIFGNANADRTFDYLQGVTDQFLQQGVRVYGMTVLPRTKTRDAWVTREGQTPVNADHERQRVIYNGYLLSRWKAVGLTHMFDAGHAIDPHDSGLWNADNAASGHGGGGFASIAQGKVTAVAFGSDGSYGPYGVGYPPLSEVPCVALNAPGDPHGTGAAIMMHTNERGMGSSFTVTNPGRDYRLPPLVAALGQWCNNDGVHECKRGYDAVISYTNLGPDRFLA